MNNKFLLILILLYSILLTSPSWAENLNISASGGWYLTIDYLDLISGAGSNLKSTYLSPPNATLIDIKANKNISWTVYARKTPEIDVSVFVRRTSDGIGNYQINGGENFIKLEDANIPIFQGKGERIGITIQYRITGVSLNIVPGLKNFRIFYTIEER